MKTSSLEKTVNGNFVVKSLLTVSVLKDGKETVETKTLNENVFKKEVDAVEKLVSLGVKIDDAVFALELMEDEGYDFASFGIGGGLVLCGDKEEFGGVA